MGLERRAKQRVRIAPDRRVELSLGGNARGRVLDVSAHGIAAALPGAEAGGEWNSASVILEGRHLRLGRIVVRRVHGGVAGLEALDAATRGALWDLTDRLRQQTGAAVLELPDPGAVPDRGHYTEEARRRRLDWAREHSGAALASLDEARLDPRTLTGNIENLVGTVEVPVGLAGPLLFTGEHARGHVTAPLATTEGTLVASTSRGAKAITRAGGVGTRVLRQRMSRAPLYEFADVHTAVRFSRWIEEHLPEIREQVRTVSRHARLVGIEPKQIGRAVHLRFAYETGDAAGQNMTTAGTWQACLWITAAVANVPGLAPEHCFVEGNASGDKKLSYLSLLRTRGSRVTAECYVDRATLRDVLKVTPEELAEGHQRGVLGGLQSGVVGYNINVANVVAAIYAATGQDIACVHESGSAIFSLRREGDGIYASLLLPALVLGTVGGGTGLPNQRDYLELIGCAGEDGVERLAEIVAGFALALDLSTLAAVVGGQFADAHERLGRNRPVSWFTADDLVPSFFQPMLAESLGRPDVEVKDVVPLDEASGSSIVSELTSGTATQKLVGLVPLRLRLDDGDLDVVLKAKPLDEEVVLAMNRIASLGGNRLADAYSRWRDWIGFKGAHLRELAIYRSASGGIRRVMPRVYGTHEDRRREAYVIVMERLDGQVILKDSAGQVWSREHVDAALTGIAGAHAEWLGREEELLAQPWLGPVLDASRMTAMRELWLAMAEHNAAEYPEWIDPPTLQQIRDAIAEIPDWWAELEAMPRTLVHNDFNPRNIALRRDGLGLVAYDWELATLHVPQRDLAELLAFTLPPDVEPERVEHHLEVHRRALEEAAEVELDPEQWRRGYRLALRDFAITRGGLYLVAHTQRSQEFLERGVPTVKRLIQVEDYPLTAAGSRAD